MTTAEPVTGDEVFETLKRLEADFRSDWDERNWGADVFWISRAVLQNRIDPTWPMKQQMEFFQEHYGPDFVLKVRSTLVSLIRQGKVYAVQAGGKSRCRITTESLEV